MTARPNAFQRFIHRLLMLRPVTALFTPWIRRADQTVLRLTNGKYAGSELVGWNIIQLTAIGAKTGQPRTVPLVALLDGEKIALIASNFGRRQNPGWYYNLKSHPECRVQWKGRTGTFIARETDGLEYQRIWQLAVSYYAGYEKYQERAGRKIPVIILELKK